MITIKFSHNWNNKLNCKCFTTIRVYTKLKMAYYQNNIGKSVNVELCGKFLKTTTLHRVEYAVFKDITLNTLALDVGTWNYGTIQEIFQKFGITREHGVIILGFGE